MFALLAYTVTMFVFLDIKLYKIIIVAVGFGVFGQMMTMNLMKNLYYPVNNIIESLERLSKGDFSQKIEISGTINDYIPYLAAFFKATSCDWSYPIAS